VRVCGAATHHDVHTWDFENVFFGVVTSNSHKSLRQGFDNICCHQADLAEALGGDVACKAVDVNAEDGGIEVIEALADEGGYYSCEDVAGAGGGHSGVAGFVRVDSFAVCCDGSCAFEDNYRAGVRGERGGLLVSFGRHILSYQA